MTSIPEHRNPWTLAPICPNVDMVAHTVAAGAKYTISLPRLALTLPVSGNDKVRTVRMFKQTELADLLALIPADVPIHVYFHGAAPRTADKLLADLVKAGYKLLGVAWHHDNNGRLGWIAFQSPVSDSTDQADPAVPAT